MASNIRPLPRTPSGSPPGAANSASRRTEITPNVRGQLLVIFRRLAAILDLTEQLAEAAGKVEQHTALSARLAIFRARVQSGAASPLLGMALTDFGQEFRSFMALDLGLGPSEGNRRLEWQDLDGASVPRQHFQGKRGGAERFGKR
jgi:hypothetical protein